MKREKKMIRKTSLIIRNVDLLIPKKVELVLRVRMTEQQQAFYNAIKEGYAKKTASLQNVFVQLKKGVLLFLFLSSQCNFVAHT